jgi:thiazole synthase ThiGH ThiG subunit
MLNKAPTFSEIRTPSSYPASEKRYIDGSRAGPRVPYPLTLYGRSSASLLLLGTARYDSSSLLAAPISAADPAMPTVSVRRQLSGSKDSGQSFWNLLRDTQRPILPNTAGCLSAGEAIKMACMPRELFQTDGDFIKPIRLLRAG